MFELEMSIHLFFIFISSFVYHLVGMLRFFLNQFLARVHKPSVNKSGLLVLTVLSYVVCDKEKPTLVGGTTEV